mgnify:CR=1 FL=1
MQAETIQMLFIRVSTCVSVESQSSCGATFLVSSVNALDLAMVGPLESKTVTKMTPGRALLLIAIGGAAGYLAARFARGLIVIEVRIAPSAAPSRSTVYLDLGRKQGR